MSLVLGIIGTVASIFLSLWTRGDYYQGFSHGILTGAMIVIGGQLVQKMNLSFVQVLIGLGALYIGYLTLQNKPLVVLPQNDARKPLLPLRRSGETQPVGAQFTEGNVSPKGKEVTCDLPNAYRLKNTGGIDGAGLCVFTSANHSAFWQQIESLYKFQEQMKRERGGGYPEKFDAMVKKYAPGVQYVQHTGGDDTFLDDGMRTQRMLCVTYAGRDNRYNGPIAHMVNLVYLDQDEACILDNNFPGKPLWMGRKDFLQRWRDQGGGWAVCFLNSPPPPAPRN